MYEKLDSLSYRTMNCLTVCPISEKNLNLQLSREIRWHSDSDKARGLVSATQGFQKRHYLYSVGRRRRLKQIAGSRNVKTAANEAKILVNYANRDRTGEALEGLRAGFREFLFEAAVTGQRDILDRPFISGVALTEKMNEPGVKAIMGRVLNTAQQKKTRCYRARPAKAGASSTREAAT